MSGKPRWGMIIVAIVIAAIVVTAFAVAKVREWTFYPADPPGFFMRRAERL
jgi:hypothetical protein